MLILSVDPGILSGIAVRIHDTYRTFTTKTNSDIYSLVIESRWDYVIVESFATDNNISKFGLRTVELVGGLEALCWHDGLTFVRRTPMQRTPFVYRAKQKLALLQQVHTITPHEISALSHLIGFEAKLLAATQPARPTVG